MLAKRIIPCLDVAGGRVVKGINFVDLRDAGDPVEMGETYSREGADELVFLDISASVEGRETMLGWVRAVAERVFIPLTVGGGIGDESHVGAVLRAGADKVSINTAAVRDPSLVRRSSEKYGAQCIVVAIDARRTEDGGEPAWEVFTHGGRQAAGRDVLDWAEEVVSLGAGELLVTSMDRDGTVSGYDVDLLRSLSERVSVPLIASGGAGSPADMLEAFVAGADAALAASIFHYGEWSIREVKEELARQGVKMRL